MQGHRIWRLAWPVGQWDDAQAAAIRCLPSPLDSSAMPDAIVPSSIIPAAEPSAPAHVAARSKLEAFAGRVARMQNALPDEAQAQMTTRWSTLFD